MPQKALTEVIDRFSAAVTALAEHAPPDTQERLQQATGDLLEALATAAQQQAGSAALGVLDTVEKCRAELQRLRERVKEDEASQAHINQMIINLLETEPTETEIGGET